MLLNRDPSWRQWSRPQPVNQAQDLGEQCSRYGDLCELECGIAAMSHNLGTDLDQFLPQRGQRPVLLASGSCYAAFGKADVSCGSKVPVSQGHRPRPDLGATRKSAGRFPTFVT